MRTVTLTKESTKDILENLLKRSPSSYGKYEMAVAQILDKVKQEKDQSLFGYTKEFDKADITAENIKTTLCVRLRYPFQRQKQVYALSR